MAPFHITLLTLFPEYFNSLLTTSLLGKAQEKNLVTVDVVNIRDFATDKHRTADDLPYGGGAGMVMKAEPLVGAIEHVTENENYTRIFMTPQGELFNQQRAEELSKTKGIVIICGHYEGIDQRVRDHWVDLELSIGDYVLTGGEPAAAVVVDAVVRLRDGVVGNPESLIHETHQGRGFDYPQYTRPRVFRGYEVPEILLGGHHANIEAWREEEARRRTQERRPDLLKDSE